MRYLKKASNRRFLIFKREWRWIAAYAFAPFLLAAPLSVLPAQATVAGGDDETILDRVTYDGDVFTRAIFISRDLPLPAAPIEQDTEDEDLAVRSEQGYAEYFVCKETPRQCQESRRREEQDFYTFRFRLNMAFRASPYADVLFGLEVGDLIFGREPGGRGAGANNLETRRLLLRLHDRASRKVADIGVLNFSTPNGLVLARSGAGLRVFYDPQAFDSAFEGYYIRSIDNSQVDGDSNGYSDENFSDVNLGVFRWKWNGMRGFRPELYAVYSQDDDPTLDDESQAVQETSRLWWVGLFTQIEWNQWELMLHGVGNWGRFHRLYSEDPEVMRILDNASDPLRNFTQEAVAPPLYKQYKLNAGAGQAELAYRISDRWRLAGVIAGASGRPLNDAEPDGSSVDYRADQWRTAGASFQFSGIAVDDSGGYSVFATGRLTGARIAGVRLEWQALEKLETRLDYYRLDTLHDVTTLVNGREIKDFYTRSLRQNQSVSFLGEEWNLRFTYNFFTDLRLNAVLAYFNAATGYKALYDVEYGDSLYEAQFALTQQF